MPDFQRGVLQRYGALLLAVILPLLGGRMIYHCDISGVDRFDCCCEAPAVESAPACCCAPKEEPESAPCKCCEIRLFEIESLAPQVFQLDPGQVPTIATSDLELVDDVASPPRVACRAPEVPRARAGPLFILHAALLI